MEPPYSDMLLDHFERPRNAGSLDKSSARVGTGIAAEPDCGDVIKLQVEVDDCTRRIVDVRFKTYGCGAAIAAGSFTTEWLKGRTVDGVGELKDTYIAEALSLPEEKLHCSVLADRAAKAAVEDWRSKRPLRLAACDPAEAAGP